MGGGAVTEGGGDGLEVSWRTAGGERVVGLAAGSHVDPARVGQAGRDVTMEGDGGVAGIDLLEPIRRGDLGFGRNRGLARRVHCVVGVQAAIAIELIESLAGGIATGVGDGGEHLTIWGLLE